MAGTKRKAGQTPRKPPDKRAAAPPKSSPRIKPSVEYVEVSSERDERPRQRGALRGLDPNNMLAAPMTQPSVEQPDEADDEQGGPANKENRHMTRAARHGRTDDRIKYDMKYHPMDKVTRPAHAAQRLSGSRSVSASTFRKRDGDMSDASLPSSAKGSDEEASESDESEVEELPTRTPDPRATRHSIRTEANKMVNYSRKHHPQDYGLPGHMHAAKRSARSSRQSNLEGKRDSPEVKVPKQSRARNEEIVATDPDNESEMDSDQDVQPSKPRKKRKLSDERSSPQNRAKKGQPAGGQAKSAKSVDISDPMLPTMCGEDETATINELFPGDTSHQATSSDRAEAAHKLNGIVDNAEPCRSSLSAETLFMIAVKQQRPIGGLDTFASDDEAEPSDRRVVYHEQFEAIEGGGDDEHDSDMNSVDGSREEGNEEERGGIRDDVDSAMPEADSPASQEEDWYDIEDGNTEVPSSAPKYGGDEQKDEIMRCLDDCEDAQASETHPPRAESSGKDLLGSENGTKQAEAELLTGREDARKPDVTVPFDALGKQDVVARKASNSSRTLGRSSVRVASTSSTIQADGRASTEMQLQQPSIASNVHPNVADATHSDGLVPPVATRGLQSGRYEGRSRDRSYSPPESGHAPSLVKDLNAVRTDEAELDGLLTKAQSSSTHNSAAVRQDSLAEQYLSPATSFRASVTSMEGPTTVLRQ